MYIQNARHVQARETMDVQRELDSERKRATALQEERDRLKEQLRTELIARKRITESLREKRHEVETLQQTLVENQGRLGQVQRERDYERERLELATQVRGASSLHAFNSLMYGASPPHCESNSSSRSKTWDRGKMMRLQVPPSRE